MALSLVLLASLAQAQVPTRPLASQVTVPAPVVVAAPDEQETALTEEQKVELGAFFKKLAGGAPKKEEGKSAKDATQYLRLGEIKNNYWRTAAQFTMNGRTATVGFGVSRGQDAYMSVLSQDAAAPALVNIKGLLDAKRAVSVNGRSYEASLSPNIFDKLGSKLKIAGNGESRQFKLRDLIGAAFEKGFPLTIGGASYRLFYYDDVVEKGGYGAVDASKQNVTLVVRSKDDFEIFILPVEEIPADHLAVYTLSGGGKLALQRLEDGQVLALRPNP